MLGAKVLGLGPDFPPSAVRPYLAKSLTDGWAEAFSPVRMGEAALPVFYDLATM